MYNEIWDGPGDDWYPGDDDTPRENDGEIEQPDTLIVLTVPADVVAELAARDQDMFRAHGERFLFIAED